MPKFVLIFRGAAEATQLSPAEMQAHLARWYAWSDAIAAAGRRVGGQALAPGGKTLRGRERVVTDGPYAESKDLVAGSMVITADSIDDAVADARGCPVFEFGGSVEVRPVTGREI